MQERGRRRQFGPRRGMELVCSDCKLSELGSLSNCIGYRRLREGEGPINFLLLGEAPGPNEDREGLPFVGKAGKILERIVESFEGLDLSTVAVSNVVRCFPGRDARGKIKAPSKASRVACRRHLESEIESLRPEVLIALGNSAWKALKPENAPDKLASARLKEWKYDSLSLFVTFHPAAIIYNAGLFDDFYNDLHSYLVPKPVEENFTKPRIFLIDTLGEALRVLHYTKNYDRIGLDIETRGFYPDVISVGLYFNGKAYVVDLRGFSGKDKGLFLLGVHESLLLREDLTLVGHNIKYDLSMLLRSTGDTYLLCKAEDSMLYHHTISEHSPTRSLEFLVNRYNLPQYKEIDKEKIHELPPKELATYNGLDAYLPIYLIERMKEEIETL